MKDRGKVIVFGAAPVNIKPIEATLSAMNVNSIFKIQSIEVQYTHVHI